MDQSKPLTVHIALAKTEATIHPEKISKILNTASTTVHAVNFGKHHPAWLFQIY